MLDDNGIRPPVIAAGINLFGGPLGLIHRHVTGRDSDPPEHEGPGLPRDAQGLRRASCCSATTCCSTSRADAATSGEMKAPKTGLLHATMQADATTPSIVPMAVAYDLVLEDHILAHQGAQAAAAAVRARSRRDGALRRRLPVARVRDVRRADPPRRIRPRVAPRRHGAGAPDRATPSAGSTRCCRPPSSRRRMRPSITRRELEARADAIIETCAPPAPTWA